jgi:hypothetical protein
MKRVLSIFSLMAFLAIITRLYAQIDNVSAVVGIGKSSIVGESDSWQDPFGFQVGVSAPLVKFSEPLSLRGEINFSSQGANWEESYGGTSLSGKVSLLYLEAPIVVRYQAKNGFYGEAGLQPGLLLSAKDKYSGHSDDYKDYVNVFDLGLPLGVGYEFENNFGIGIRVIPGLLNINKEDSAKDRNLLALVRATYTFKLK